MANPPTSCFGQSDATAREDNGGELPVTALSAGRTRSPADEDTPVHRRCRQSPGARIQPATERGRPARRQVLGQSSGEAAMKFTRTGRRALHRLRFPRGRSATIDA